MKIWGQSGPLKKDGTRDLGSLESRVRPVNVLLAASRASDIMVPYSHVMVVYCRV